MASRRRTPARTVHGTEIPAEATCGERQRGSETVENPGRCPSSLSIAPIFAWVIAILIMMGGRAGDPRAVRLHNIPRVAPPAVSVQRDLSRCVGRDGAEHGRPGHRAAAQRHRSPALFFVGKRQRREHDHHAQLRAGDQPRHRAGAGAKQAAACDSRTCRRRCSGAGVRVAKSTKNFLMVVGFVSTDGTMSASDISDFVASKVQDPISRTLGVGDYILFGSQYAMRIWLDPAKLNNFSLTATDVSAAITAQNVQVASGELGEDCLPRPASNSTPRWSGRRTCKRRNSSAISCCACQPERFGGADARRRADRALDRSPTRWK